MVSVFFLVPSFDKVFYFFLFQLSHPVIDKSYAFYSKIFLASISHLFPLLLSSFPLLLHSNFFAINSQWDSLPLAYFLQSIFHSYWQNILSREQLYAWRCLQLPFFAWIILPPPPQCGIHSLFTNYIYNLISLHNSFKHSSVKPLVTTFTLFAFLLLP